MRFAVFFSSLALVWFTFDYTLSIYLGETTADIGRNLLREIFKLLLAVDCLVRCNDALLDSNAEAGVPYYSSRLNSWDERILLWSFYLFRKLLAKWVFLYCSSIFIGGIKEFYESFARYFSVSDYFEKFSITYISVLNWYEPCYRLHPALVSYRCHAGLSF